MNAVWRIVGLMPQWTMRTLSPDDLGDLYREPSSLVTNKVKDTLDPASIAFVGASPFVLVSTAHPDGRCDVSPKGGPAGFVKVLEGDRVAIPDLNGNNLLDSLRNITTNPHAGLIFLGPGRNETLRINGRAIITDDDAVLDLFVEEFRRPKTAIVVDAEEVFLHCGKAFLRSGLWDPESWRSDVPTGGELLASQLDLGDAAVVEADLEQSYVEGLAEDQPVS